MNTAAPHRRRRHVPPTARPAQRGLATLVVVMVLLLVMALVAGYTNRNLFFEQRVSANQYRATQAMEAAEAGLEWGLAMLNAGRIDGTCQPQADPASVEPTFRQRYLDVDLASGALTARTTGAGDPLQPSCVRDGAAWQCSCPADGAPVLAEPAGLGPNPAFRLRFVDLPAPPGSPPGVVRLEAIGCTRLDADDICADAADTGDGRAAVSVLVALQGALTTVPSAAVTARGTLDVAGGLLQAVNADAASGGRTVHAGVAANGARERHTVPGSFPAESEVAGDPSLAAVGADPDVDLMFNRFFGMEVDTYRQQPATIEIDCDDDCSAERVRDLVRLNPGRMVWIDGDFDLDIADAIGTPDTPALLVVDGRLTASDAAASVIGLVYMRGTGLTHTGALTVRGALAADTDLTLDGAGTTTAHYDGDVLARLRRAHGGFVRVPGSWKDF